MNVRSPYRARRGFAADLQLPLSSTQEALQNQVRAYLDRWEPCELARRSAETGAVYDDALWREMASMDWLGMLVPDDLGGTECSLTDVCVVAEELGRTLLPSPFLATSVLATSVLRHAPAATLLSGIADGSARLSLALVGDGEVTDSSPRPTVSGRFRSVVDADSAHLILVACRNGDERAIVAVEVIASGTSLGPIDALDPTRHLCTLELDAAPCTVLLTGARAEDALAAATVAGAVALAAELVGGARACLAAALEHATNRGQFGRPIGSFQAIKHRCVDVLVAIEAARAAVAHAARVADEGDPDALVLAGAAKSAALRALYVAATAAIQIQGGAGFLWDTDAHLFLRRAKASEGVILTPAEYRAACASSFGI